MPVVTAVIGSNFGDEGKGLMTDFVSAPWGGKDLVVRFNGGAQAGHTVVAPGGRRHVFHHFGSGTLTGTATFLGPRFISNPALFASEWEALKDLKPKVFVDQDSPISTPYDALLNQAAEMARGESRHGSCGVGIWETEVRNEELPFTVSDLLRTDDLVLDKILWIRDVYLPLRARALGIDFESIPLVNHPGLLEHFLDDCKRFIENVVVESWGRATAQRYNHIVFEGAQGLRLDQDSRYTPYVSGSKTGLANVRELMLDGGLRHDILNVYYVTRPYITRHGAGPLPNETQGPPYPGIVDKTNVFNEWQRELRFGLFDIAEFIEFVATDIEQARRDLWVSPQVAVTCVDHLGPGRQMQWLDGEKKYEGRFDSFVRELLQRTGMQDVYVSTGETRHDVRRWE